jgi:hypothetical protein
MGDLKTFCNLYSKVLMPTFFLLFSTCHYIIFICMALVYKAQIFNPGIMEDLGTHPQAAQAFIIIIILFI